jgi:hypothetical protein
MCANTETDVRESANDCILASGEGHGSRGETFQLIYVASPVSSSVEHPVLFLLFNVYRVSLFLFFRVLRLLCAVSTVNTITQQAHDQEAAHLMPIWL